MTGDASIGRILPPHVGEDSLNLLDGDRDFGGAIRRRQRRALVELGHGMFQHGQIAL